ncbi:MAG: M48 family metallopeptidase [Alphaproteobacteria bacterium]|nr:M48 family metallopeptidase [Alphaproteobacteria bacterium]
MSEYVFESLSGQQIPVVIESRRGSRSITIRPRVVGNPEIHISKPWLVADSHALKFLESKRKWVEKILEKVPQKCVLCDGDEIEFLDKRVCLIYCPNLRSNEFVQNDNGTWTLRVGGGSDMFERRVRDVIKAELLKEIKNIIRTTPREFWPARIALRDTTTRWGSCSSSGTMSFSWRLAFAPVAVMRYVVMHELAHKKHMNHSPAFWHQVSELYGFGVERAKRWLAQNGASLHRYF